MHRRQTLKISKEWIQAIFPKNSSYFKLKESDFSLSGWRCISEYRYHYVELAIIETKEEADLFHLFWRSPMKMEFGAIISKEKLNNSDYKLHSNIQNINYYINEKHKDKIKNKIFHNSIFIS